MNKENIVTRLKKTLEEISNIINLNLQKINSDIIVSLVEEIIEIHSSGGMIFLYGAGRSGFIGRTFAQRLMHLGINSCFISDAVTYRYSEKDLLILISGSGETVSPKAIAIKAKEIGGKVVVFTTNPDSSIAKISNFVVLLRGKSKDKAVSQKTLAPYTSLFDISTLAILDSIGGILMEELGLDENNIDNRHASLE